MTNTNAATMNTTAANATPMPATAASPMSAVIAHTIKPEALARAGLMRKLQQVQTEVRVGKDSYNSYGKYSYRSAEDILEKVKPALSRAGLVMTIRDDLIEMRDEVYVKVTVAVTDVDTGAEIETTAYARESKTQAGMVPAQMTGSSSSYAKKYALGDLLLLSDASSDPDSDAYQSRTRAAAAQPMAAAQAPRYGNAYPGQPVVNKYR